jgi:hypothetical protein
MTVHGSCHCGSVRLLLAREPDEVVACDCSLCARRGMLWAHYPDNEMQTDGFTEAYVWGDGRAAFHHCPKCGCTTHWHATAGAAGRRGGVNARLIEDFREIGGADTSRYAFGERPVGLEWRKGANG